jgi:type VI secretion system secreted protein Hcp
MAIYMQYEGIKGDVTEEAHKDWIELQSISLSAFREAQTDSGQGSQRQGGNVSVSDLTLTKSMCMGSPHLFVAGTAGLPRKVTIHVTRTGEGEQTNYLEVVLDKAFVNNHSTSSDGANHMETITLNFLEIDMKYTPVKPDGKPGEPIPVSFKVPTGEVS